MGAAHFQHWDVIGIYTTMLSLLTWAFIGTWPGWEEDPGVARWLIQLPWLVVGIIFGAFKDTFESKIFVVVFGLFLIGAVVMRGIVDVKRNERSWWAVTIQGVVIALLFGVGAALRDDAGSNCACGPDCFFQKHAIWHLLTGLGFFGLFELFCPKRYALLPRN